MFGKRVLAKLERGLDAIFVRHYLFAHGIAVDGNRTAWF